MNELHFSDESLFNSKVQLLRERCSEIILVAVVVTIFFNFFSQKKKGQEQCNKAIMVITDGPSETYKEIFETHNWPNKTVS